MIDPLQLTGPSTPPKGGRAVKSIVVFLHGYGSNGEDLLGLAPYWQAALPNTLFVAPNAPQPHPAGGGAYQWWPLTTVAPAARAAGVRLSAPLLNAFLDGLLAKHSLPADQLALVGFSQGTMMALHVGPRRDKALAGIIGYSGMLADPTELAREVKTKPAILLSHGDADSVLPVASLSEAKTALQGLGFQVASHISRGLGHSLDDAGLALGRDFLTARLR